MSINKEIKTDNTLTLVEFHIGGKTGNFHYGLNIAKTKEIINPPELFSEFSKSHPAIMGIAKIRGASCLFIDLATWMGKPAQKKAKGKAIITTFHNSHCGFCVSSIVRTTKVPWSDVKPPDTIMSSQAKGFVTGVIETNDAIISLLDFEGILSDINATSNAVSGSEFITPRDRGAATIFVVEDSRFTRRQIIDLLSRAGYRVFSAGNGVEALEKLQWVAMESENKQIEIRRYLNLIITDIELPIMDGTELISKIKGTNAFQDTPIVVFSSIATKETADDWLKLGATDIVPKPDLANLLERVDSMVFGTTNSSS